MKGRTKQTQPLSPAVTRPSKEKILMERISELENKVTSLSSKVNLLEKNVEPLQKEVLKLRDVSAISEKVTSNLQKEVERLQQYSRRNCVIIEGIEPNKKETIHSLEKTVKESLCNEFGINNDIIEREFDKTHRVGHINKDNQQMTIVRFKSHEMCNKIYRQKKKSVRLNIKPSLTKFRINTLKKAKEFIVNSKDFNFVYADILGNLKIRSFKPIYGRYVHSFYDLDELADIIHDVDFNQYDQ